MENNQNKKRVEKIKKLAGKTTDRELSEFLKTNQPQIHRWKTSGFHQSTANLLDFLLSVISKQKSEIRRLKNNKIHV